jgi:hypothetical protein
MYAGVSKPLPKSPQIICCCPSSFEKRPEDHWRCRHDFRTTKATAWYRLGKEQDRSGFCMRSEVNTPHMSKSPFLRAGVYVLLIILWRKTEQTWQWSWRFLILSFFSRYRGVLWMCKGDIEAGFISGSGPRLRPRSCKGCFDDNSSIL